MPAIRTTSLLALASAALFALPAFASAAAYYVAPNGVSSTCSSASPCSLNGGLDRAGNGDEVILKDGVYRQSLATRRNGVTFRAENRHKAIIQYPSPGSGFVNQSRTIYIRHSDTTVRGLVGDGSRRAHVLVSIQGNRGGPSVVRNVLVEDNYVHGSGSTGMSIQDVANVVIRHNIIEDTGHHYVGEGIYMGGASGGPTIDGVEVYGNVFREVTDNLVDYKGGGTHRNVNVHHNIFEDTKKNHQGFPGDGLVRSGPAHSGDTGHRFHDNIVRDSLSRYIVRAEWRVDVQNNVFYNIDAGDFINSRTTSSAVITGNTLCNAPSRGNRGNNRLNAPQSQCDAEVARIMNEMKSLPGAGSGMIPGGPSTPSGTPCHTITSPETVPAGFGVPYSAITSTHEQLIAAGCQGNDINVTVGNAQSPLLVYAWPTIHYWLGSTRKTTPLTCAEQVSGWCRKEGSATITANQNETWLIGYACQWDGRRWWCGCRTTECRAQQATGSLWQAQLIEKP